MKTAEEVLVGLKVQNAGKVAELLRAKAWERGVRLDAVFVEDCIRALPDGRIRFAMGGTGSFLIDPRTLQVME